MKWDNLLTVFDHSSQMIYGPNILSKNSYENVNLYMEQSDTPVFKFILILFSIIWFYLIQFQF